MFYARQISFIFFILKSHLFLQVSVGSGICEIIITNRQFLILWFVKIVEFVHLKDYIVKNKFKLSLWQW